MFLPQQIMEVLPGIGFSKIAHAFIHVVYAVVISTVKLLQFHTLTIIRLNR